MATNGRDDNDCGHGNTGDCAADEDDAGDNDNDDDDEEFLAHNVDGDGNTSAHDPRRSCSVL